MTAFVDENRADYGVEPIGPVSPGRGATHPDPPCLGVQFRGVRSTEGMAPALA